MLRTAATPWPAQGNRRGGGGGRAATSDTLDDLRIGRRESRLGDRWRAVLRESRHSTTFIGVRAVRGKATIAHSHKQWDATHAPSMAGRRRSLWVSRGNARREHPSRVVGGTGRDENDPA